MTVLLLAVLIGIVAGLRAMLAPAAVSWACALGWIDVSGTALSWLAIGWVPWLFTLAALAELVGDKLPTTPSRKRAGPFAARLVSGALCGWALVATTGMAPAGAVAGLAGGAIGTLGGAALRARLAGALGRDWPAALIEDALAVAGALAIVSAV